MNPNSPTLIGPFTQLVTLSSLPNSGPISDNQLHIIPNAGIIVHKDNIIDIQSYNSLKHKHPNKHVIDFPAVALPGFVDCHTHICYAGSRASEYALRVSGKNYQDIAANGGGILNTVKSTREASKEKLIELTLQKTKKLLEHGITTCEVKSGYGLSILEEVKILEVIQTVSSLQKVHLIPTCLAAHVKPPEFASNKEYLDTLIKELFPLLKKNNLSNRIDIFVEQNAFSVEEARYYLQTAKQMGFSICLHADQFSRGGALLAAELGALSADHLEVSQPEDFAALAKANVIPVALPGASLGLGLPMPKARQMLDAGLALAIASDWNPGSAPMGNLLAEAAILGASQKLTMAETLAGITIRAARALELQDRGSLEIGKRADLVIFPCTDYREILYNQGSLMPYCLEKLCTHSLHPY